MVTIVSVVIRRYIDILIIIINFPYSTCIRSFFGSSMLTSLFILKMFFRSLLASGASLPSLLNYPNFPYIYWRAERAPHLSYSCEKSSSYIYMFFIYIYVRTYVRCARAVNARYAQTSDRPA